MDYEYDFDNWEGPKDLPLMAYTYAGGSYPAEVSLSYPAVQATLSKQPKLVTDEELQAVLALPTDELREDLHRLIAQQLALSSCHYVIRNCMMCLLQAGDRSTLPVVLEVMRQNETFRKFHFDGWEHEYIEPLLYRLCKDQPRLLLPYLLEPGLHTWFKTVAIETLSIIANRCPEVREEMLALAHELFDAYRADLPFRRICDGEVVGFALGIPIALWAEEFIPLIEEFYQSGMVDYGVQGKLCFIRRDIRKHKVFYDEPATDPFALRK